MANNVNVEELRRFISQVKQDVGQAKKAKRVEGRWVTDKGKPQFVARIDYTKGHMSLECELPPILGGWGNRPDPVQYCLYGLASCYAATFATSAALEGVAFDELSVTAESSMNLNKQIGLSEDPIIEAVKFTVRVKGNATEEQLKKVKELADKRCPGVECLTRSIPLTIEML
jgi:uncharacterized OsmC-like protein